ncbi:hypothetical protein GCM10010234_48200 [Streptomyces hawaiiensis]
MVLECSSLCGVMITFPSAPNRTVYPSGNSVCTIASALMDGSFPCVVRIRRTVPCHLARRYGRQTGPDRLCGPLTADAGDPQRGLSHGGGIGGPTWRRLGDGAPELVTAVRSAKQYLTYVSAGPFQYAIAEALSLPESYFAGFRCRPSDARRMIG